MSIAKLIVLSGYSGSGKTTLAEELQQTVHRCVVIHADDYYHCCDLGMDFTQMLIDVAAAFAQYDVSVIVDAVNKHPADRMRWEHAALMAEFGYFEWRDLDVPIAECIRRDAERPQPVGMQAILSQAATALSGGQL